MKTLALTIMLFFGLSAAWADDADQGKPGGSDRMSLYTGAFGIGLTPDGIIRTCDGPPPEGFPPRLVIRATYAKLAGVCDDFGPIQCAGRFTRIMERCFGEEIFYQTGQPGASTSYVEHRVRICYDESAQGNCDDVDEVASGTLYQHFTSGFFNNLNHADHEGEPLFDESNIIYDREIITDSKSFTVDGERVRVPYGLYYGQSTGNFSDDCLFDGLGNCGQTGTLIEQ